MKDTNNTAITMKDIMILLKTIAITATVLTVVGAIFMVLNEAMFIENPDLFNATLSAGFTAEVCFGCMLEIKLLGKRAIKH